VQAWEVEWKAKEKSNHDLWVARESDNDDGGWGILDNDPCRKEWADSDGKVVISHLAIN
jgi:hypothetical protein